MYYCPFLSVAVYLHYTGDVIVIYVIFTSCLTYIRVHNSMVTDISVTDFQKSQHNKIDTKQNTSTIYCHIYEDCYCYSYR